MFDSYSSQGTISMFETASKTDSSRGGGGGSENGPLTFILVSVVALIGGCCAPAGTAMLNQLMLTSNSYCWPMSVAYSIAAGVAVCWALTSRRDVDKKEVFHKAIEFLRARPLHYFVLIVGIQGLCQATFVALGSYKIGSALMTLSQLISNIALSLVIDQFGLLWTVKRSVTALSLVGLVVMIGGAIIYRLPALILRAEESFAWWWIFVGVAVGCSSSLQSCFGGKFGRIVGSLRFVVAYSYTSGSTFAILASLIVDKPPPTLDLVPREDYWLFCCGLIMMSLFVVTSMCPRWIPLAVMWAYFSFGQMITSFILDSAGLLGLTKKRIDTYQCVGLVVALTGIVVLTYAKQRPESSKLAALPAPQVNTLCHPEPKV